VQHEEQRVERDGNDQPHEADLGKRTCQGVSPSRNRGERNTRSAAGKPLPLLAEVAAALAIDQRPRMPSNTSAKAGWFEWEMPERAASMTSGSGWPWSEAMMICFTV